MTKRVTSTTTARRALAILVLGAVAVSAPAAAQRATVTTTASAVKVVVVPFTRENVDSALSVQVADAVRDRLRTAYGDRMNAVEKRLIDTNLVLSGFPVDMPLEPTMARRLAQVLNARLLLEGVIIPLRDDSVEVVGRLNEVTTTWPQSASFSVRLARRSAGERTGRDIANRLADYFRSFEPAKQCQAFRQAQDYAKAMQAANDALRRYATSSQALLCMAQVMRAQNAPADTVIRVLERALNSDSMNVVAQWQLARFWEEQHDTVRLIQSLHHVLIADPTNNTARIGLAQLHQGRNELDSAAAELSEGIDRTPNQIDLIEMRSRVYALMSRFELAGEDLARIARVDTSKVDSAFVSRAYQVFSAANDTANMIAWARRALERFPSQTSYLYSLALLLHARADTAGAIDAIRRYVAAEPDAAPGHLVLASYLYETGQYDSAYAQALVVGQADTTLRPNVAGILFGVGARRLQPPPDYPGAAEILGRAQAWSPAGRQKEQISYYLGIAQYQMAVAADSAAMNAPRPSDRDARCEAARREAALIDSVEANVTEGGRTNPETAQMILTQAVPAYRQRASTFIRQARCPAVPQP
jgi:tetratricopeptide (TPR) repeat protein